MRLEAAKTITLSILFLVLLQLSGVLFFVYGIYWWTAAPTIVALLLLRLPAEEDKVRKLPEGILFPEE